MCFTKRSGNQSNDGYHNAQIPYFVVFVKNSILHIWLKRPTYKALKILKQYVHILPHVSNILIPCKLCYVLLNMVRWKKNSKYAKEIGSSSILYCIAQYLLYSPLNLFPIICFLEHTFSTHIVQCANVMFSHPSSTYTSIVSIDADMHIKLCVLFIASHKTYVDFAFTTRSNDFEVYKKHDAFPAIQHPYHDLYYHSIASTFNDIIYWLGYTFFCCQSQKFGG